MPAFVAALGGVFLYSADPQALASWYKIHLGLNFDFEVDDSLFGRAFGYTPLQTDEQTDLPQSAMVWSIAKITDDMVATGRQRATVNYRVFDMEAIRVHLADHNIELEVKHYTSEGYFAHLFDPDGNKLELWQDEFVR